MQSDVHIFNDSNFHLYLLLSWRRRRRRRRENCQTVNSSYLSCLHVSFWVYSVTTMIRYDYPTNETTFYSILQAGGYQVGTVGKDDLTKNSQVHLFSLLFHVFHLMPYHPLCFFHHLSPLFIFLPSLVYLP